MLTAKWTSPNYFFQIIIFYWKNDQNHWILFCLHMIPNICNYSIKDFVFLKNKKSLLIFLNFNLWKIEGCLKLWLVGWEDKRFLQFDWWRRKVCLLGLYTKGHRSKDKTLRNAYMEALFVSFGAKNLVGE